MTSNTHNDLRTSLREIFFEAAGGITDMANEEIDETINLFVTRIESIKAELPDKNTDRDIGNSSGVEEANSMIGFNQALSQVHTILDNEIKRLKGEVE